MSDTYTFQVERTLHRIFRTGQKASTHRRLQGSKILSMEVSVDDFKETAGWDINIRVVIDRRAEEKHDWR